MVTKKIRRGSGWETPRLVDKSMKFDEIVKEAMEPQPYYDDWGNYRDGMRDWPGLERKEKEIKKEKRSGKIQRRRDLKRDNKKTTCPKTTCPKEQKREKCNY